MSTCDEICCLLSTGKNGDSFEKFEFFFFVCSPWTVVGGFNEADGAGSTKMSSGK